MRIALRPADRNGVTLLIHATSFHESSRVALHDARHFTDAFTDSVIPVEFS